MDACTNISVERNHTKNMDLSGIATTATSGACSDIRILNNFLDESPTGASAISLNSTDSIVGYNIIKEEFKEKKEGMTNIEVTGHLVASAGYDSGRRYPS